MSFFGQKNSRGTVPLRSKKTRPWCSWSSPFSGYSCDNFDCLSHSEPWKSLQERRAILKTVLLHSLAPKWIPQHMFFSVPSLADDALEIDSLLLNMTHAMFSTKRTKSPKSLLMTTTNSPQRILMLTCKWWKMPSVPWCRMTWMLLSPSTLISKKSRLQRSISIVTKPRDLNGISACFFQAYWDVIGAEISHEIQAFFESSILSVRMNETHVCLIPNGLGSKKVVEYRLIAICNVSYKIIAKIFSRCLQLFLHSLILDHQSAFEPGRAITDNVLITHEILHLLRISKARKRCTMAVKTDMTKAFNCIEWSFLRAVFEMMGFHEHWIGWIMKCVTSVSYSFLLNGRPQGKVTPTRGLREGDPLSPYLIIMCSKVFSSLCRLGRNNGSLKGVSVARGSPTINHLFFCGWYYVFLSLGWK